MIWDHDDIIDFESIKEAYKEKNYIFDERKYYCNIFGIRSDNFTKEINIFDDMIGICVLEDSSPSIYKWKCTTAPGLTSLKDPTNIKGTAILVEGQHKDTWKIGLHKSSYEALVQCKNVSVYRDNNRDSILDYEVTNIDTGLFGINIHRANANVESVVVNNWSAGCSVIANPKDFDQFMALNRRQKNNVTQWFTYTLFREDFIQEIVYRNKFNDFIKTR